MSKTSVSQPWGDTFAGTRVLVTGDTGFKGSWLSFWLATMGAEVTGLALPPTGETPLFARLDLTSAIRHRDTDIRDGDAVRAVLAEAQPEIVIHLAAQSLVYRSFAEPKLTFDTNVGGAVNLLEAVRETPSVSAVVFITSDKCYRNKEWQWGYRENDELGGRDPYSASKAAAELVFAAYRASLFQERPEIGLATTRAGNVVGGGDMAADRVVPDCIRALSADRPIELRRPEATRPWQHVLEPLSGYLTLAARLLDAPGRFSEAWNFGPEIANVCTVGELAEKVADAWGGGRITVNAPDNAPYEATLLHLNTDKAQLELGWRQRWDLSRTLGETTRWYREVEDGRSPADITREQIAAYEASL